MQKVILDGKSLDLAKLKAIALDGAEVEIEAKALAKAGAARQVLFDMADQGKGVYGLNRGLGWNKDREFGSDFFEQYNRNVLNTHSLGIGPNSTAAEVRAMMAIRLNTALAGSTGMAIEIIDLYKEFLNHKIHPVVPRRGSIGEADITTLAYIGLAFMGEWDVEYLGEIMPATEAMAKEKLIPTKLGAKDGLSIVSSNAQGGALAALAVLEAKELVKLADLTYCLSLEGLNGGIEPIMEESNAARGLKGQIDSAAACRANLEGSYLYQPDSARHLQDPLSYRGAFTIHGAIYDALDYANAYVDTQMNTTDDNPYISIEKGTTFVSANFEVPGLAMAMEMLAIGLGHLSKNCCYQTIKLADPYFTGINRFLTSDEQKVIGFATVQKLFTALDTENRYLLNPSSMDYFAISGTIEDHANNLPLVADKVLKMIDNIRYILAIQLMHAAQAIDLQKANGKAAVLGANTEKAYQLIRSVIPFWDKDRNVSLDINKVYKAIIDGQFADLLK